MNNKYMNTMLQPEERAQALLSEMSLDEKIAQINGIFRLQKIIVILT